jgi:hypothetical protein
MIDRVLGWASKGAKYDDIDTNKITALLDFGFEKIFPEFSIPVRFLAIVK